MRGSVDTQQRRGPWSGCWEREAPGSVDRRRLGDDRSVSIAIEEGDGL